MSNEFDHFGIESYRKCYKNLDAITKENVLLLEKTMKECGFSPDSFEWWHFNDVDDYNIIFEMFK